MRNTSFSKMAVLPVGLLTLALTMPSCSSNEYKKLEGDKAKQVASIIRITDVWNVIQPPQMFLFTANFRLLARLYRLI